MDENRLLDEGFRLISTSESDRTWMTEDEILGLIRKGVHFMDVTDRDFERISLHAVPKKIGLLPYYHVLNYVLFFLIY